MFTSHYLPGPSLPGGPLVVPPGPVGPPLFPPAPPLLPPVPPKVLAAQTVVSPAKPLTASLALWLSSILFAFSN